MSQLNNLDKRITHHYVKTNGVRLHCVSAGQGDPVILLHGFPEHWYSWRYQIPALASRRRVIVPDLRGYNLSDKPPGVKNYDIDILADDVLGLLEWAESERAVIVGHDWGGAVAWWFAIRHQPAVEKLIVMNCPHPVAFRDTLKGLDQLMRSWYIFFFQLPFLPERFVRGIDLRQSVERIFRGTSVVREQFTDEDIDRFTEAIGQPGALTAMINYYRAVLFRLFQGYDNATIDVPTLVIWGEQDRFLVTRNIENLDPYVKNLTIERIRESGHWVQQEQPEIVNEAMLDFIS